MQQYEVERKTKQLAEREFELNIRQMQNELFSVDQRIKTVNRDRNVMASDSDSRVKLSLWKEELENKKKKHKKM